MRIISRFQWTGTNLDRRYPSTCSEKQYKLPVPDFIVLDFLCPVWCEELSRLNEQWVPLLHFQQNIFLHVSNSEIF